MIPRMLHMSLWSKSSGAISQAIWLSLIHIYDGLRDGQAHACSLNLKALVLAAIEFVKDQAYFHIFDARALIRNARDQRTVAHFR